MRRSGAKAGRNPYRKDDRAIFAELVARRCHRREPRAPAPGAEAGEKAGEQARIPGDPFAWLRDDQPRGKSPGAESDGSGAESPPLHVKIATARPKAATRPLASAAFGEAFDPGKRAQEQAAILQSWLASTVKRPGAAPLRRPEAPGGQGNILQGFLNAVGLAEPAVKEAAAPQEAAAPPASAAPAAAMEPAEEQSATPRRPSAEKAAARPKEGTAKEAATGAVAMLLSNMSKSAAAAKAAKEAPPLPPAPPRNREEEKKKMRRDHSSSPKAADAAVAAAEGRRGRRSRTKSQSGGRGRRRAGSGSGSRARDRPKKRSRLGDRERPGPDRALSPLPRPSLAVAGDAREAEHLAAARRMTTAVGTAGEGRLRPGDWNCSVCQAHNFASKFQCFRCSKGQNPFLQGQGAQGAQMQPTMQPQMHAGAAQRPMMMAANVKVGDWLCQRCSAHNYASKFQCFRCGQGKNPVLMDGSLAAALPLQQQAQMGMGGRSAAGLALKAAAMVGRPGSWQVITPSAAAAPGAPGPR